MEPKFTIVKPVVYLGLWTATVDEQPAVVISVRLDTDSFAVTNLSLTANQAKRLAIDLVSRFAVLSFEVIPMPQKLLPRDFLRFQCRNRCFVKFDAEEFGSVDAPFISVVLSA